MASLPIIDLDIFRTAPDSAEAHAEAGKVSSTSRLRYNAEEIGRVSSGAREPYQSGQR